MRPLVSVVIPVYNAAQYLKQCIDSIVQQTYKNLEILLVDDGSNDGSEIICQEYAICDSRIRLIQQKNQGASHARNAAISVASGEYIIFVDSDDWIDLGTCESAVSLAKRENADLVLWSYLREYIDESRPRDICGPLKGLSESDIKRKFFGLYGRELEHPEELDSICTLWGKMYRTECLRRADVELVDLGVIGTGEDVLFNMAIAHEVKRIALMDEFFYHYRKYNVTSITAQYKENLWKKRNVLYDHAESILEKQYPEREDYRKALQARIAIGIVGLSLNIFSKKDSYKEKRNELREILCSNRYRLAISELEIRYMPLHWKVFFVCASLRWPDGILLLSWFIKKLKARV